VRLRNAARTKPHESTSRSDGRSATTARHVEMEARNCA
jgi:hypothetical protein